jgi:ABC-type molybdenum transport system ATPase subunit/photorepair protein PhrA
MLNVATKLTGNKLVLTIDLSQNQGLSGSGKSTVIATTQGNQPVGDSEGTKFGLNVYCPIKN